MRMRRAIPCLALTLALLCATPAGATPAPRSRAALPARVSRVGAQLELLGRVSSPLGLPSNGSIAQLTLEAGDGYEISVLAFEQTVLLAVSRREDPFATTMYLAHGRVTPRSIRASFADRGRIALRFRPSGRLLRLPPGSACASHRGGVLARLGVYVGELRFRGEGGYTSAQAHRVKGSSIDIGALVDCLGGVTADRHAVLPSLRLPAPSPHGSVAYPPSVPTHPTTGPKPTTLIADDKLPVAQTVFGAQAYGSGRVQFLATEAASEGSIGIARFVFAAAPPAAFAFDDALSLAGVTPPPPFSGSATFTHGVGGARSWTGSLAVSFLGAADVPLTGASFNASLRRGW
jgi:hypothetical protein